MKVSRMLSGALVLTMLLVSNLYSMNHAAPKIYLTEAKSNDVAVVDSKANKVIKRIPVQKGAHGVAITPDGKLVFVSSDDSSVISVIDTAKDEIIATIATGKAPHGLITKTDGKYVYAAIFGDNQVLEISTRTFKVERTFDVPSPHNLALSADGKKLYVASQKSGEAGIGQIDLSGVKSFQLLRTESVPRALNLSPNGKILTATEFDHKDLQIFSTNPLKLIRNVEVGDSPHHTIFTPDGKVVLVGSQISNNVALIDTKSWKVITEIAVGQKPHWIAPTNDSKYAYITDEASNDVSIVDLEERKVEGKIPVGDGPRKIVVQPGTVPAMDQEVSMKDSSATSNSGESKHVIVKMQDPPPRFNRDTVVIEAGTSVEWINAGSKIHTVTDEHEQWDSGSLAPGEKFTREFPTKGTFHYFCVPHRNVGMMGTIVVK